MKKKMLGLFGLLGLLGIGLAIPSRSVSVHAKESVVQTAQCTIIVEESTHGTVAADKTEGSIGEVVTLEVKADVFYLIDSVKVNGTSLVESETTKGKYTFTLAEGENKINASFVVDGETLGAFTEMFEEFENKDYKNLFSVKNVITIVSSILDCGLLIAMVRYFIKDKRLEKKVENAITAKMDEILPETTKNTVIESVTKVLEPIFTQNSVQMTEIAGAVGSLVKCMALSQENTPESRKAIIDELSSLNVSDKKVLSQVRGIIEDTVSKALAAKEKGLNIIQEIKEVNKEIINKSGKTEKEGEPQYDGTSI